MSSLRSRLTFANTVSLIALFVALGGTSYAAFTVTGKHVKNSSLTGKDLKNSSVTGADVKNRSLSGGDFKRGQLPAGPQGARGRTGPRGLTGAAGSARAYGEVSATGVLTRSKNIAGITKLAGQGRYCINTTFGAVSNIVATLTFGSALDGTPVGGIGTASGDCPNGTDAHVYTYRETGVTDQPFFFILN